MVVEAATIISDGLDLFAEKYGLIPELENKDKYEMIKEVLVPGDYNLIVTPKEIDDLIENMSKVVARRD